MDYYLTDTDIQNIVGKDNVKIITYDDIHKYKDIDELFYDETDGLHKNTIALLYIHTTGKGGGKIGHWNALIKYDSNDPYGNPTILHFDSYGDQPDAILNRISESQKKKYYENHTYLLSLLYNANRYQIEYNNKKLQGNDSATCGRWVCAIILLKDLTIDQFDYLFSPYKNISSDDLVLKFIKL